MSKVLFLVNHDVVIYNFRLEIVERLLAEGHQVVISSPYGERIDDLKALGCDFREIEISRHGMNPMKEYHLIKEYKGLFDEINPDIVFSFTIKPNIYGAIACRSRKVPIVCNITGLGTAVEYPGIKQKIAVLLYKYAFTDVKTVFFQNKENEQFFLDKRIALGKHEMLPGSGVNLNRFPLLPYPEDEKIRFVFIARIMKEKGIDYYLETAKYISEKYPGKSEFHVCGFIEEGYDGELFEYDKKGFVVYHGMVRDITKIHKQMHCTVFPSYYPEGLSNVLLEAAACGRPIITTDRPGCREAVENGVSGYLIPICDQDALNDAVEKFLNLSNRKKSEMGFRGRAKVEKEFDRNIVVEKYLKELCCEK